MALDAQAFAEFIRGMERQIALLASIDRKLSRLLELNGDGDEDEDEDGDEDGDEDEGEDDIGLGDILKAAGTKLKEKVASKVTNGSGGTTSPKE